MPIKVVENIEEIIKNNAAKGYIFVAETSDGLLYKKSDEYATTYYIDCGYPDTGAFIIWTDALSISTLEAVLKDLKP